MYAILLLAVLALPARAGDCLFDGACGPRPAAVLAGSPLDDADAAENAGLDRWDGVKKGASEGALFGFFAGLYPALALVDEGFGRKMSRHHDGARPDNGDGKAYYYGGVILAAVLYLPALVLGGLGGLLGGAAGAAAPEAVSKWDAEKTLFD